ncbi:hypothetical protein MLD38_027123 [Melastoma candidum]|uniref:Uncharacterized protein n=1 Tax=Melastoma candidum TaxID=119954 RepID=A0ACB9P223_9MYRT|nr:hypothetical protein MLD38_027123 [Melastoma candidum]
MVSAPTSAGGPPSRDASPRHPSASSSSSATATAVTTRRRVADFDDEDPASAHHGHHHSHVLHGHGSRYAMMRRRLLGGIQEGLPRRYPGRRVLSGLLVMFVFSVFVKGTFFAGSSFGYGNGLLTHASVKEELVSNRVVEVKDDGDGCSTKTVAAASSSSSSSMPKRVLEKLSVSEESKKEKK